MAKIHLADGAHSVQLGLEDQKQLRLTCQSFGDTLAAPVLRSIRIFGRSSQLFQDLSMLRSLVDRKSAICAHTLFITFGCLHQRDQDRSIYDSPFEEEREDSFPVIMDQDLEAIRADIQTGLTACLGLHKVVYAF